MFIISEQKRNYFSGAKHATMQSILVPTDFSQASYHTARYAMLLAADFKLNKIVLYNAYQPFIPEDPEFNAMLTQSVTEYKSISEEGLKKMKNTLEAENTSIEIIVQSDYNTVTSGIENACKKYDAAFILMNTTTAGGGMEEAIFGSNAVNVAKHIKTPCMIIPSDAVYTGINKILLTLDFKNIENTTPVNEIKKLLDTTGAMLDIVHIETNEKDEEENLTNEKSIAHTLFGSYNPQYHFLKNESFINGINHFAIENNEDLVVVIPKKHKWFENIFRRSHTKTLAFHSHIPVMVIHE